MTMPLFPGNPYAIVRDGFVIGVVYAPNTPDSLSLEDQLIQYEPYNKVISFNEYGEYISIGAKVLTDGYVAGLSPFPSWVWNDQSRNWEAPVKKPTEEESSYSWNESLQIWEQTNCLKSLRQQEEQEYNNFSVDAFSVKDFNLDLITNEQISTYNNNTKVRNV